MAVAPNAKLTNQDGNVARDNARTAKFRPHCLKQEAKAGMSPMEFASIFTRMLIRYRVDLDVGMSLRVLKLPLRKASPLDTKGRYDR